MPIRLVLSIALNESFNGDGTVVSYLNNVRRTKETIMKLWQWMRSFLALSLLMILCASASAATVHHTIPRHHVIVRPSQGFPGYAVPGSAYAALPPTVHYDDTPSYNDPSKFGGPTALPIEN
jgi:hypothetical protein